MAKAPGRGLATFVFTLVPTSKIARATHVISLARNFLILLSNILEQNKLRMPS